MSSSLFTFASLTEVLEQEGKFVTRFVAPESIFFPVLEVNVVSLVASWWLKLKWHSIFVFNIIHASLHFEVS